jgi:hypothetical protein
MEHRPVTTNESDHSILNSISKEEVIGAQAHHLEDIKTASRVPSNDHYYEKDGLRTYGDNEDHEHEPPVNVLTNSFEGYSCSSFI